MNIVAEIKVSYSTKNSQKEKITSSDKAYSLFLNSWSKKTIELQEEFKVMMLNNSNEVLGIYSMSKGGITGTVVDVRLIFAVALKCNATAIILAHNHPSGKLKPSDNDLSITKKIKSGSNILDINLLDHLIVTKNGHYSFQENGMC
jgi:DNA repair protein RadC